MPQIIVATFDCEVCGSNTVFEYMNSSTAEFVDPLKSQYITYSDLYDPVPTTTEYQGSYIQDTVCFDKDKCVDELEFFGITMGAALPPSQGGGILGLGQSSANYSVLS